MKFGFDLHGVIDAKPELFAALTYALICQGHEVHILTGPPVTYELKQELEKMGIRWTHLFSIIEGLKLLEGLGQLQRPMYQDEHGGWWASPYDWDRMKGDYCRRYKIDFHLDDSDHYGYFFTTPYARFYSKDTHRIKKTEIPNVTERLGIQRS